MKPMCQIGNGRIFHGEIYMCSDNGVIKDIIFWISVALVSMEDVELYRSMDM